jgi:AAHS family 4-hydroxybenzoate transporter-like MFS transporter
MAIVINGATNLRMSFLRGHCNSGVDIIRPPHMSPTASVASSPVDVARVLDEGRWTPYQQRLVALTALAIIFDGADNQLLGVAVPAIMRDWHVARAAFAPVLALGMVGMMIGGAAAGMAGDRIGRKTALISTVVLFGLATAAAALAHGIPMLAATRLLAGIGLGGAFPNAAALASEFVPRRHRPLAVTMTIVCVPLGGTVAGLLALRVLPALGWRMLFVIGGAIPLAAAALLLVTLAESPRYLLTRPQRRLELLAMLRKMGHVFDGTVAFTRNAATIQRVPVAAILTPDRRRDTIALWCAFFASLLAVYLGFNWIPSMLTGAGLSPAVGSTGIMMFNLGGVAAAILGALTFPRLGSRVTMLTLAAGAAISAAAMGFIHIDAAHSTIIIVMLAVTGGFINAVQTTMYALAAQMFPTEMRATGVGSAVAVGRGGAILSTYAGAWALDAGGPRIFFLLIAGALAASAVALAAIRRHIPRVAA